MDLAPRRAIFPLLVNFLHQCEVTHHSWVFNALLSNVEARKVVP